VSIARPSLLLRRRFISAAASIKRDWKKNERGGRAGGTRDGDDDGDHDAPPQK